MRLSKAGETQFKQALPHWEKAQTQLTSAAWRRARRQPHEADSKSNQRTHGQRRIIMTNAKYAKLTTGLIFVWFLFSLTASALHLFTTEPNQPPLALGLAVLIPIGIFVIWSANSQPFRQFLLSLDPRTLTFVQAWRIAGFVFLVLYAYNILPGQLALPAGWGDIAIGATAPLIALKASQPQSPKEFHLLAAAWNYGPGHGSSKWRDCPADESARDRDHRDDGASHEPDSDLCRTSVSDPALHLHRPGASMAGAAVSARW